MNQQYTAAVIGLGRIGFTLAFDKKREQPAAHCAALSADKRIHLVAGCDCCEPARQLWKKAYPRLMVYEDAFSLFAHHHPDIVCIAVNESEHNAVLQTVLQSRPRLVILEKPAAVSVAEAEQMQEQALRYNVPVMINHERRFAADYRMAKQLIAHIGQLQDIRASLWSGMRVYDAAKEKSGAYSLLHDGTHLVDILQFLLDEPLYNPVLVSMFKDSAGAVRNVSVGYSILNGASVTVSISGRSRFFGFDVDMYGTEGRIHIGNGFFEWYTKKESSMYTGFSSLKRQRLQVSHKTRYFSNMVHHAVTFLDGNCELESTLADGIADMRMIENIKKLLI